MTGPPLNGETRRLLQRVFAPEHRALVEELLESTCGHNLPLQDTPAHRPQIQRIRQAVIRLSKGDLDELRRLIGDAQRDWRDVLVWDHSNLR